METLVSLIEEWKKAELQLYCLTRCDAHCCSYNLRSLSEEQVRLIFAQLDGKITIPKSPRTYSDLLELGGDGTYTTKYPSEEDLCPRCVKGQCQIYADPLRPQTCADYPFSFKSSSWVKLEPTCPAMALDSLLKLLEKILVSGYKVSDAEKDISIEMVRNWIAVREQNQKMRAAIDRSLNRAQS